MATKAKTDANPTPQPIDALKAQFAQALVLLDGGKLKEALQGFASVEGLAVEQGAFGLVRSARSYQAAIRLRMEAPANAEAAPEAEALRLLNRRDADAALAALDKALKAHKDRAVLHYLKATAHAQKGDAEASSLAMKQALELDAALYFQYRAESDFEAMRRSPFFAAFERD